MQNHSAILLVERWHNYPRVEGRMAAATKKKVLVMFSLQQQPFVDKKDVSTGE